MDRLLSHNYLRLTLPPQTGRHRGGSVSISIFVNTALPRRAPERPRGEGALIKS